MPKNDVIYSTTFKDMSECTFEQSNTFKTGVLLWFGGAVPNNGKLPLKFIDKGVKIGAELYKQDILATHSLLHTDRS